MSLAFFETSVLVYADDNGFPQKQEKAIALFSDYRLRDSAVVSLHVLQEYFVTTTRKLNVSLEIAQKKVELLAGARGTASRHRSVV